MRLWLAALAWLFLAVAALAQDRVQLHATSEQGFGRLVLEFSDRIDLPAYKVSYDNNVLAITFAQPVSMSVPDMSITLPDYATIGRLDPDGRGVRFGLRNAVTVHSMEAGEKLFVDLLPAGWQGLPPSLPPEVVAELTQRAKDAAVIAEQKRKAEEAKALNPKATIKVGRNPTFYRVEVDWSVDTKATYKQDGTGAAITFDWPVPIDLYAIKADLPSEIQAASNAVTGAGSALSFTLADGVTPRFYAVDGKHFTFDIDLNAGEIDANRLTAEAAAMKADAAAAAVAATKVATAVAPTDEAMQSDESSVGAITPVVDEVSGTVRISFPFERDTASAVFRRGDTLWMLFDTRRGINQPAASAALSSIASAFTVSSTGDSQLVRVDLSTSKLASLASAGRSWVLSIGDVLLNATQPVVMTRNRDQDGQFEMSAELGKPFKVHSFRDPTVGDVLDIVTAFPPAQGVVRDLSYVDFDALRSVHGLVLRPVNDALQVSIADDKALIRAPGGLFLSDQNGPRLLDAGNSPAQRDSYVDFASLKQDDPAIFSKHTEELSADAAMKEGQARDVARLALAQYYVGNQFAQEAIGVLKVVDTDLKNDALRKKVKLTTAIADVLAARPKDALAILNNDAFGEQVDALMWRAIARANAYDYVGARADALASDSVLDAYPTWVKHKFLFAAIRAAVETSDAATAQRYLKLVAFAQLSPEDVTLYQLLQARVAEMLGQTQEALDEYGQVIAADVRPTRAEAVYRTMLLLRQTGKIDAAKATTTLAAEAMLWRGNPLEVDMEKLLAELYFANKDYRLGFEIAKDAASNNPESKPINDLLAETQAQFTDLFLNGAADQLGDLEALSLYYDFRDLTPAGAKGDEMIRNLARRLVRVDLLTQAGDLLQYQVDNRLKGVAQSQVATDLALIRIADRNPEAALRVLNQTRMANLTPALDRERRILEARALIDGDRSDLALDLLSRITGRDADLLRVDGYWGAKNYTAASNLIETIYSTDPTEVLNQAARMNIVKAAVGLVLANDPLGLSRLRSKFSGQLAQSPEWPMFDYITSPQVSVAGEEFKAAAKAVAGIDAITGFLDSYRKVYATDTQITPTEPSKKSSI